MRKLAESKKIVIPVRRIGERPPTEFPPRVLNVSLKVDKTSAHIGEAIHFYINVCLAGPAWRPMVVPVSLSINGENVRTVDVSFGFAEICKGTVVEYAFDEPGVYTIFAEAPDYARFLT